MRGFRFSLAMQIFTAMILGIIVGAVVGKDIAWIKIFGDIFLRLLQMLVVPFIFVVLVTGAASVGNPRDLGRVGLKLFALYELTSIIAITLGLTVALLIQPGVGLPEPPAGAAKPPTPMEGKDLIMTIFPSNVFDAATRGDVMQIIVFALFFGVALGMIKKEVPLVLDVLEQVNKGLISLIGIIMALAPYGVFALMTWTTATYGLVVLVPLAKYLIGIAVALTFQIFVVCGLVVWFFAKLDPIRWFKKCWDFMAVAFTTCSAAAALPVMFKVAEYKIGIKRRIWAFTLPLGAMNQDGTALYQAMAAVLIAQFYHVDLSFGHLFIVIMTALLASTGTFAVPGAGLITLAIVLRSAGLPLEGIALIAGVDRIADMFRTTLNVVDDMAVTTAVAHWENGLDRKVFESDEEVVPVPEAGATPA